MMRVPAAWLLFGAAFLPRLVLVLREPQSGETFFDEPGMVAYSLSHGEGFSNPYAGPTGPSAHVAPFVPLLLAFFIKVFGNTDAAWLASRVVACAVVAFHAALLPTISERVGLGRIAGILAGLVAALPLFLWLETNGRFETPYLLLATTLLVTITAYWLAPSQPERSVGKWAWLGLGWGLGVLLTPTLLPVMLALLALGTLPALSAGKRLRLRQGGAVLGGALLVFMPYSIERSVRLGAPVLVRSNFGLELFLSNNDAAHPRFLDNMADTAVMKRHHPLLRRREAIRVRSMGEGAYHTMMRQRATDWIASHPQRFASLTGGRIAEFWFPTANRFVKTAYLYGLTVFGVGWLLVVAFTRSDPRRSLARFWLSAVIAFSLIHYVIQADVRYRYPLQGLLLLAACACFLDVMQRVGRSWLASDVH
ncbi:MAG: hypothetical protein ACRENH_04475 [Gemmatimonadaceae bacterium]